MKYITLIAPNHDEVYLFPTEGIIVQGDPDNDKQTLISVQGTERRVVGHPEDIADQIERMFAPDEIDEKAEGTIDEPKKAPPQDCR